MPVRQGKGSIHGRSYPLGRSVGAVGGPCSSASEFREAGRDDRGPGRTPCWRTGRTRPARSGAISADAGSVQSSLNGAAGPSVGGGVGDPAHDSLPPEIAPQRA
ncbi:hypothetical protein GCM10010272_67460 [Streptomyces lateritius]|nr:hypothetical protein GCM10010272_67460 [Streptomyces lateritius]